MLHRNGVSSKDVQKFFSIAILLVKSFNHFIFRPCEAQFCTITVRKPTTTKLALIKTTNNPLYSSKQHVLPKGTTGSRDCTGNLSQIVKKNNFHSISMVVYRTAGNICFSVLHLIERLFATVAKDVFWSSKNCFYIIEYYSMYHILFVNILLLML